MPQTEIKVRVRPTRVAILVADSAPFNEISMAVRFLSRIWGGRFCPILPVTPGGDDPWINRMLSRLRPDFVYGVALDDTVWSPITEQLSPNP